MLGHLNKALGHRPSCPCIWAWCTVARATFQRPRAFAASNHLFTSATAQQQASVHDVKVKDFREMPGPKPLPLFGNLFSMSKNQSRRKQYIDELIHEYGGVAKLHIPGSGTFVVVAEPDMLEEVLRAEGKYPIRDTSFTPKMRWFESKAGVPHTFSSLDGEEWRESRMKANKQIQPAVVNRYIDGLNPVYSNLTKYLRDTRDSNQMVDDFADISRKVTMQATGKFIFDADLDLLSNTSEHDEQFMEYVDQMFSGIEKLITKFPTFKIFPTKFRKFYLGALEGIISHGRKYAGEIRKKVGSGVEGSEVQSMLEQWLRQKNITTEEALSLSAQILMAGIHTTANQSAFLLYQMGQYPDVQEKLYQEIQSVLGSRLPTAKDLESMSYMRGCIKESFRMNSTSTAVLRVLAKDAVICGYHVPAGVNLWYSLYTASKDERIFQEPKKFLPERWDRTQGRVNHPFALLPFGFGPRACYGKRFAEMEMKLLLIEIVRNFQVRTAGELSMVEKTVIVVDGKLPLYFKDRM